MDLYNRVSDIWHRKIPDPDIYVYLDVKPTVSICRLKKAELLKERPKEFPSENTRKRYIFSWYELYSRLYSEIVRKKRLGISFLNTEIICWPATLELKDLAHELRRKFIELAERRCAQNAGFRKDKSS